MSTTYEKNKMKWDREDSFFDAILLAFEKPIVYDYIIPEMYRVNDLVKYAMNELDFSDKFKRRLDEITLAASDSLSQLEFYIDNFDSRFESEWFRGYGTCFKWCKGEKEKAKERVDDYVSEREMKELKKLQEYIRKKMNVDIPKFGLDEAIGRKV